MPQCCDRQASLHTVIEQLLIEVGDCLAECSCYRAGCPEEQPGRLLRKPIDKPFIHGLGSLKLEIEKQEVVDSTTSCAAWRTQSERARRRGVPALATGYMHQSNIGVDGLGHSGYFTNSLLSRQPRCKF